MKTEYKTDVKGVEQFTLRLPARLLEEVKSHARKAAFALDQDVTVTEVIAAVLKKHFHKPEPDQGKDMSDKDYLLENPVLRGRVEPPLTAFQRAKQINDMLSLNTPDGNIDPRYTRNVVITHNGIVVKSADSMSTSDDSPHSDATGGVVTVLGTDGAVYSLGMDMALLLVQTDGRNITTQFI